METSTKTARLAAISLAVALGLAVSNANASTVSLTPDAGWSSFSFGDVGSSWDTDFTFTLTGSAILKVVDAYLDGDQFEVYDSANLLAITSDPVNDGTYVGNDPDAAWADVRYSRGSYALSAGTYDISGKVKLSPYGGGGGFISVVSAVPLPAALPLFGSAIMGLGLFGRRRKQQHALEA